MSRFQLETWGKMVLVWKNAHYMTHDISLMLPVSMAAVHAGDL